MAAAALSQSTFAPKFLLAVDCCRANFRGTSAVDLRIPSEFGWPDFLRLIRYHRIEGLAWNAMRSKGISPPADIEAQLSRRASQIARQSLIFSAECRGILDRFGAAGLPLLFLKGSTLGALAYANPTLKSGIDIDLLIDAADLSRAAELLSELGFRLHAPRQAIHSSTLHTWHRLWKESVWAKDSPPVQVDLHTRCADNRHLIPCVGVRSPSQLVDTGNGLSLPTLASEELFAYLAVHGASSAWFRLKWISDFAAMIEGCKERELERLYQRSQQLSSGRCAAIALLLADRLFGTLSRAADLRNRLERNEVALREFERALRLLRSRRSEPTAQRWGTLPIHRMQFALLPGLGFKVSEVSRQARQMMSRAG